MSVQPLVGTTQHLHPHQTVFVVREGWVFPYMPAIVCEVRSARQARYASSMTDLMWWPTPNDWRAGEALQSEINRRCWRRGRQTLAWEVWRAAAKAWTVRERGLFDLWWESGVSPDADPVSVGASAAVAARMLCSWQTFSHRYLS